MENEVKMGGIEHQRLQSDNHYAIDYIINIPAMIFATNQMKIWLWLIIILKYQEVERT